MEKNNSRTRDGISIDSSRLITKGGCLGSSPEVQGLLNALKLRTKLYLS